MCGSWTFELFVHLSITDMCKLPQSLKSEFDDKHFVWELVEEVERPHVLVAKVAPMTTKDNLFAQVVVRIHTQQVRVGIQEALYNQLFDMTCFAFR